MSSWKVGAAQRDVPQRAVSSAVDEAAGLLDVAGFAQCATELDQAELDLRVPADALQAAGCERVADVVGCSTSDLGEPVLANGSQPNNRRLKQVPGAVKLVAHLQVAVTGGPVVVSEAGVEVSVRVLGAADARGEPAQAEWSPAAAGGDDGATTRRVDTDGDWLHDHALSSAAHGHVGTLTGEDRDALDRGVHHDRGASIEDLAAHGVEPTDACR